MIPQGMRKPLALFVKSFIANGFSRSIAERDFENIHKEAVSFLLVSAS